jgi:heme/copper-type cytochrome/quinol oxidase subunit 3
MRAKNKDSIITQHQYEREENARKKIEKYFMTGQISSEVAIFTLGLIGFSVTRAKQIVKQWTSEKHN